MKEVRWREEEKTLTLTGEPVLTCRYVWPETGHKKLDRYYRRVVDRWKRRWERTLYWQACLDLAEQRERSRPFTPWSAQLLGETTYQDEGLLSLYMEARERRGDGRTLYGRSGDLWEVKTGAPVVIPLRARRQIFQSLALDAKLRKFFSPNTNICLRPGGLEVWFPQCTIAPAGEGLPTFLSKEVDFLKQTCYTLENTDE